MIDKRNDLSKIVGVDNIIDDEVSLHSYSYDHSFVPPKKPHFVIRPGNTREVIEIVNWANKTHTPLVPVSSGAPHFYGDTIPSLDGSIIVDVSRMKQILKVDRRNRVVLVEPGVTFNELIPELAKQGLQIPMPLLPRRSKSVVTSFLERQPTLTPKFQRTLIDPLRCVEIVWGNGEIFMTGEAGSCEPLEKQWQKHNAQVIPFGPHQTDYYRFVSGAQGTMGIVTWASIRCEVLAVLHKYLFTSSDRLEDLLDFVYKILRIRFGDEISLLNNSEIAYILGSDIEGIEILKKNLPLWTLIIGIAGRDRLPQKRVEYQESDILEIAQQVGVKSSGEIPGLGYDEIHQALHGVCDDLYWKFRFKSGCQDIFFLTTLDRSPRLVDTFYQIAKIHNYPASDVGIYIQPVHQGAACHCEFTMPFDRNSNDEVLQAKSLYEHASEELLKRGAFFSRPYGIWSSMAYAKDLQTTMVLKKIKQIFDPSNVMNPGKLCF